MISVPTDQREIVNVKLQLQEKNVNFVSLAIGALERICLVDANHALIAIKKEQLEDPADKVMEFASVRTVGSETSVIKFVMHVMRMEP